MKCDFEDYIFLEGLDQIGLMLRVNLHMIGKR